jgi:hypothetical protein
VKRRYDAGFRAALRRLHYLGLAHSILGAADLEKTPAIVSEVPRNDLHRIFLAHEHFYPSNLATKHGAEKHAVAALITNPAA